MEDLSLGVHLLTSEGESYLRLVLTVKNDRYDRMHYPVRNSHKILQLQFAASHAEQNLFDA